MVLTDIVEDISEYINKVRQLGQTDDQIKQALLSNGWTLEIISPYFSTTPSIISPKNDNRKRLLVISIIVLCLGLFGTGIVIAVNNIVKSSKSYKQIIPTIESNKSLDEISNSNSELLVFIKDNKITDGVPNGESEIIFFDLNQKKIIPTDPLLSNEKGYPSFGTWSPDGKYLPILYTYPQGEPKPLFFFDSSIKKVKKVYTFGVGSENKYSITSSGFWRENKWLDNTRLVYGSSEGMGQSPKGFTITDDGIISEENLNTDYILQNSKMIVITKEFSELQSVFINDTKFTGTIKGRVVGLVNNEILSLEIPAMPNIQDFDNDVTLLNKINNAKSEEERNKVMEDAMKPKGNWSLHFYDLKSGDETNAHEIKSNGWLVVNVQIRPKKNTIIIALKEKIIPPYTIRFVELHPSNLTYRIIGEIPDVTGYPVMSFSNIGDYFNLTSDGNWLVSYDGKIEDPNAGISAWNLSIDEKITICDELCSDIRIYNPEAFSRR